MRDSTHYGPSGTAKQRDDEKPCTVCGAIVFWSENRPCVCVACEKKAAAQAHVDLAEARAAIFALEDRSNHWYRRAVAAEGAAGTLRTAVDDAILFLEPIADKLPRIGERALTVLRAALAKASQ